MTDISAGHSRSLFEPDARTRRRNAAETRFRLYGMAAVTAGILALVFLMVSILGSGLSSFRQAGIELQVMLDADMLDKTGNRNPEEMRKVTTVGYGKIIGAALVDGLARAGIDTSELTDKQVAALVSDEAPRRLRDMVLADPSLVGQTVPFTVLASGRVDGFLKGRVTMESARLDSNISPGQLVVVQAMKDHGMLSMSFNPSFFTNADASELRPEAAGLGVAMLGSLYMMMIVLVLSLPIGVAASIYLEELAPQNRWTDIIEVNIANLAAVPAIVYGILALALFINFLGLPQSAPIVGGLVLTLMTLPTIIIATRAALKAIPPSIRQAALGIGASRTQSVFHHVLPLAIPGILTGAIIGIAQALGETAPLLLIGMNAFVASVPATPFDQSNALPVQIYLWQGNELRNFFEGRTAAAIVVLLSLMLSLNALAIWLRKRFEKRW